MDDNKKNNNKEINQEQSVYRHNILIEALPLKLETDGFHRVLRRNPYYGQGERYKDAGHRMDAIMGLSRFIYVRDEVIQVATIFDMILRQGYSEKHINQKRRGKES